MRYPHGLPGWVDLSTPDPAAATDFYTALFGWTAQLRPTGTGTDYTMLLLEQKLVCGLGPQMQEGVGAVWTTYVLVGDADEIVAATPDAGGQVLMPAMDVLTSGRMAVVADPGGAVLGLWQPRDHQGADVFNEPGTICWNELQSRDLGAALPFYEEMFGWRWERTAVGRDDYFVAHLDAKGSQAEGVDTSVAGAMAAPPGLPQEMPSVWNVYVSVADVPAVAAAAAAAGGAVMVEPTEFDWGRFAVLADPQGGVFSVMQVEQA
jgi:predicted enzyme related to lactoylglutathione lyase